MRRFKGLRVVNLGVLKFEGVNTKHPYPYPWTSMNLIKVRETFLPTHFKGIYLGKSLRTPLVLSEAIYNTK